MTRTRIIVAFSFLALALGEPFVAHATAPPGRFVAQADFVTDTATGLKWQRTLQPSTAYDVAETICSTAAFGGMATGWRIPSARELATIIDFRAPGSTLALDAAFVDGGGASNTTVWSTSATKQSAGATAPSRVVITLNTTQNMIRHGLGNYVLCVHD